MAAWLMLPRTVPRCSGCSVSSEYSRGHRGQEQLWFWRQIAAKSTQIRLQIRPNSLGGDIKLLTTADNNNNNNKRPLTPKSMPPAGDEHAKLKT